MSESSLKNKAKKGVVWSGIDRLSTQLSQFLIGLLLARLLTPSDYGIIAIPLVFLAVAQCFIDCGFTTAIIRKPDLKEEDLSTAFYFNISVGIVCYIILYFASPLIADFYREPILKDVLRVTSLATLFNPLSTVPQSLLTVRLNFKSQAVVNLIGTIISGIIGVVMAYAGYGVWALVVQQVGAYFIRMIMLWCYANWKPTTGWSAHSFTYLWGFGSKMLASGLLNTIYKNLAQIFIGKFYTPLSLGNYTRAQQFANLPCANFSGILDRITIPVLSKIQGDDTRLCDVYRRLVRLAAFIMFPIMMGMAALANPFIILVLSEKWAGCIPLLQIICFSYMWQPIQSLNLSLLGVKGRSDLFLRLEVIKKCVSLIVLAITLPLGMVWFVSSFILTSIFSLIINTYYTGKLINVGLFVQLKDVLRSFIVSIMLFFVVLSTSFLFESKAIMLITGTAAGIIFYYSISKFFSFPEMEEIRDLLPVWKPIGKRNKE